MAMTIRDVAREAGVSTATVSRALRGLPNVDPVTRERVRQVAERLDYVVSPAASRLASGRAGSIAVITPYISRWYFAIERVLQDSDLDLLLSSIGDPRETHRVPPHRKLRRRVDGFLVISLSPDSEGVREIFEADLPVALIDTERAGCWSVGIDDVSGARMAAQHLINLGHERIGLVSGRPLPTPFRPEENRWIGYRDALRDAHLAVEPDLEACGHFTIEGGERAMTTLLARPNPPTAVFAMSDEMAFGALRSIRAHGLQPGRDISVVGYDGHEMAEHLDLTTVVQPVEEVGARAAQCLLEALDHPGRTPQQITLPLSMVVRGSTALRRDRTTAQSAS
jgi:LacI family repressor for deo operon, udp, cdd, tsx, nupC, and nupG